MNNDTVQHERLPVMAQLGVLLLILTGLFGSLVYLQHAEEPNQLPIAVSAENIS